VNATASKASVANHDPHVAARPLPPFAGTVDVPAAVHPHVRPEHEAVGKAHEDVLAGGFDAFDGFPGDVDARQRREHGFEPRHRPSGERPVQRARRAEDRVSLRHASASGIPSPTD
jgi:ribosomal protein L34